MLEGLKQDYSKNKNPGWSYFSVDKIKDVPPPCLKYLKKFSVLRTLTTEILNDNSSVERFVDSVDYHIIDKTIICTITIFGFTITKAASCLSDEAYDEAYGKELSYNCACEKAIEFFAFLSKALDYQDKFEDSFCKREEHQND